MNTTTNPAPSLWSVDETVQLCDGVFNYMVQKGVHESSLTTSSKDWEEIHAMLGERLRALRSPSQCAGKFHRLRCNHRQRISIHPTIVETLAKHGLFGVKLPIKKSSSIVDQQADHAVRSDAATTSCPVLQDGIEPTIAHAPTAEAFPAVPVSDLAALIPSSLETAAPISRALQLNSDTSQPVHDVARTIAVEPRQLPSFENGGSDIPSASIPTNPMLPANPSPSGVNDCLSEDPSATQLCESMVVPSDTTRTALVDQAIRPPSRVQENDYMVSPLPTQHATSSRSQLAASSSDTSTSSSGLPVTRHSVAHVDLTHTADSESFYNLQRDHLYDSCMDVDVLPTPSPKRPSLVASSSAPSSSLLVSAPTRTTHQFSSSSTPGFGKTYNLPSSSASKNSASPYTSAQTMVQDLFAEQIKLNQDALTAAEERVQKLQEQLQKHVDHIRLLRHLEAKAVEYERMTATSD